MTLGRRIRHDDRGAGLLAAFIVLMPIVLLAGIGIIVDSGRFYSTFRQCDSIAMEAARAGANALDVSTLRDGAVVVDPATAQQNAEHAVNAFLTNSGASLQSLSVEGNRVHVVISASFGSWFPLVGDRSITREATASANDVPTGLP